jgi:hypothetical protein
LVTGLNADLLDGFEAAALAKLAGAAFTGLVAAGAGVSITGGTQAAGTLVKTAGSGVVVTAVTGSVYDLALVNAAISDYLLVNPTGTPDVRLALNGVTLIGPGAVATGASAGEMVLAADKALRGVFSGGTYDLIKLDSANISARVGHTALNLLLAFADAVNPGPVTGKLSVGASNSGGTGFRVLRIPN